MKKYIVLILVLIHILLNLTEVQAAGGISYQIDMLNWQEVDKILPRYSTFTVLDVETGKKFNVQRRAGSNHADVQPLTVKDTTIMKKIYGGKWSWKRRAIIVIYKKQWIAASMHGMPHGAGALNNNFPGHFCIHFYGSTTHRTNNMDRSHMLMILKAAGKLDDYLAKANPYEVINAYIAGIKQQDTRIIAETSLQKVNWKPVFKKVENIGIGKMEQLFPEDIFGELSIAVPIEMDWKIKNKGSIKYKGVIQLVRFSPEDRWKVDSISFLAENNFLKKKHL